MFYLGADSDDDDDEDDTTSSREINKIKWHGTNDDNLLLSYNLDVTFEHVSGLCSAFLLTPTTTAKCCAIRVRAE